METMEDGLSVKDYIIESASKFERLQRNMSEMELESPQIIKFLNVNEEGHSNSQFKNDGKYTKWLQELMDIEEQLKKTFTRNRFSRNIESCCYWEAADEVIIQISFSRGETKMTTSDTLQELGFNEWKFIGYNVKKIDNEKIKTIVFEKILKLYQISYKMKLITGDEFNSWCMANKITLFKKSAGLAIEKKSKIKHPVPEEIDFFDKRYIKTVTYEGLCYTDKNGVRCFQDVKKLDKESILHCVGLLKECKSGDAMMFRKQVVTTIFKELRTAMRKFAELDKQWFKIILEYQQFHNESDDEMIKSLKKKGIWKEEMKTEFEKILRKRNSKMIKK